MPSALERLRELREVSRTKRELGSPLKASIADRYPPDEFGERCSVCGSPEKWIWLDGRRLCRPCLIRGGPLAPVSAN
jgi:hypothetical protein